MIYRETHSSNFTQFHNSLINNARRDLDNDQRSVLMYLLSKSQGWKLIKKNIAKTLQMSMYAVQCAVSALRKKGYLTFHRTKTGHGIWNVYEKPNLTIEPAQTSAVKPSFATLTLAGQTELQNIDNHQKLKTTTDAEPISDQKDSIEAHVVVNFEEEKTPDQVIVTEVEKLAVTQTIKPTLIKTLAALTLVEAKAVLNILTRALVLGKVNNPVGYTVQLVRASQNGTLTLLQANYQPTLSERLAKEKKAREEDAERGKITNQEWVAMMKERYGVDMKI